MMGERRDATHAIHHRVLVHVEPLTALVDHLHGSSSSVFAARRREGPSLLKSISRAPGRCRPWAQFGLLQDSGSN
jgi:hypothetical protein